MSIEKVRAYFRPLGRESDILEFPVSSATVELAAQAAGVIPARIAKTLSFLVDENCVLIAAAGDAKIDNSKYKAMFHTKAKMLSPDKVIAFTGHAVGGVCPFAIESPAVSTWTRLWISRERWFSSARAAIFSSFTCRSRQSCSGLSARA